MHKINLRFMRTWRTRLSKFLLAYTNLYDEEEALAAIFGSLLVVSLIAYLMFS